MTKDKILFHFFAVLALASVLAVPISFVSFLFTLFIGSSLDVVAALAAWAGSGALLVTAFPLSKRYEDRMKAHEATAKVFDAQWLTYRDRQIKAEPDPMEGLVTLDDVLTMLPTQIRSSFGRASQPCGVWSAGHRFDSRRNGTWHCECSVTTEDDDLVAYLFAKRKAAEKRDEHLYLYPGERVEIMQFGQHKPVRVYDPYSGGTCF